MFHQDEIILQRRTTGTVDSLAHIYLRMIHSGTARFLLNFILLSMEKGGDVDGGISLSLWSDVGPLPHSECVVTSLRSCLEHSKSRLSSPPDHAIMC